MPTPDPDEEFSTYDALDFMKALGRPTTLITLNKCVENSKDPKWAKKNPRKVLAPVRQIKVGEARTMDMFTRKALEAWYPGQRDPDAAIKRAADELKITVEEAKALRDGNSRVVKIDN